MHLRSLLLTSILPRITLSASVISTFLDTNCHTSFKSFTGPNGYPDGLCTDLRRNGAYASFQIISLDPGCAVTIYTTDASNDPCPASPEAQMIGQPITCYNATYHYYSIDMCDSAAARSSDPPAPPGQAQNHNGAIVAGVVGGVLGLALIFGLVFWAVRSQRFEHMGVAAQHCDMTCGGEIRDYSQCELGSDKVLYKREAFEVEAPPAELGGQEVSSPVALAP